MAGVNVRRAIAVVVWLLVAGGGVSAQERDAVLQFEITNTLKASAEAWNQGDLERFMQDYLRSPEMTYTAAGKIVRGYEALAQRYATTYGTDKSSLGHLTFSEVEVWKLGDSHALAVGKWLLKRRDKEDAYGVFSLIFVRQEGAWKILHDHTSSLTK
ncbi:MAG: DUF4440 domain-containing protein [Vulcanimicrobiota bacterium]